MSTMLQAIQTAIAGIGQFVPLWGLLGLKGVDVAMGLSTAWARRDLSATKLADTPRGFIEIVALVIVGQSLVAVSPGLAWIVDPLYAAMGAGQLLSLIRHARDYYQATGRELPRGLGALADRIETTFLTATAIEAIAPAPFDPKQEG